MKKQSRIKLSFNPNRSLGFMADLFFCFEQILHLSKGAMGFLD